MKEIYSYFCKTLKKMFMWFASQMDKTSSKNLRSNILSPLAFPIYVILGLGTIILVFGCRLLPDIFGIILFSLSILIYLIGITIGLIIYYRFYFRTYNEDKSLLNSERTNTDRELIRYLGQSGIKEYGIKLPFSDYIIDNNDNKIENEDI